jgi:hypothetical protein
MFMNEMTEQECREALARTSFAGDKLIEPLFFRIHIDSMTGLCATDKIGDINAVNKKTAQTENS